MISNACEGRRRRRGCPFYRTLRVTPAMAAGLTIRTMDWEDILAQMDALEVPAKRGPYQKGKAEIQTEALPEIGGS